MKLLLLWLSFCWLVICLVWILSQVILFSDILTPLSGMNIPFDIVKGKGPVIFDPIHSAAQVDQVREFIPEDSVPYVGEALTTLRKEVCWCYVACAFLFLFISFHTILPFMSKASR